MAPVRGGGRGGGCALLADFEAQVGRDHGGGVIVERLVDRRDGAVGEQRLDDLGDRHAKNAGQVGHADDGRQLDRSGLAGAGRGGIGGLGGAPLERFELAAATAASLARAVRGARALHRSWHRWSSSFYSSVGRRAGDGLRGAAQPLGICIQVWRSSSGMVSSFSARGSAPRFEGGLPALGRIAQVRAAAGELPGRVDGDAAVRRADDAHQLPLRARLATGDTGALGDVPRPAPPRRGRHAGYSFRAPTGSVCCSAAAQRAARAARLPPSRRRS